MRLKRKLLFFTTLVFITLNSFSQKNNFDFYSIKDGLPHSSIFSIHQDKRGYLWMGSEGGGVSRFDGNKFYNYNKKNGLIGNTVRDIYEDKKGNIWFATDNGISYYDGYKIISYGVKEGLSSEVTFCINEDKKGNILIGTAHGGLNIINTKADSIYSYTSTEGLSSNNVFTTIVDSLDRIWVFYYGGEPQVISFINDSLVIESVNTNFLDMSVTLTGNIDQNGNIWIGTQNSGVYKISNYSDLQNLNIESYNLMNGLLDNTVWNINTKNNKILISTNSGLNIITNNKIESINTNTGLLSNKILSALIDMEDNIWISMAENGLAKLKGNEFSHFSISDGLLSKGITCIKQLKDSTFMISSIDNGISVYTINSTEIIKKSSIIEDKKVTSFDFDSHNNLWIGTSSGLLLINEFQTTLFSQSDNLVSNKINDVLVDSRDLIWMATSSGIAYFDGNEFNSITEEFDQLINNEVQTVVEDHKNNLWFGTLGGLVKYDVNHNGIYTDYNEEDGLEYTKIHSLLVDKYDNLWIGTYGDGLYYFDKSKDSINISHIDINEKLLSNNIYGLAFINDSVLVVTTDKGFNKILLKGKSTIKDVLNYNHDKGFKYIENNQNAVFYSPINNCVYFGTTGGLTLYFPEKELKETTSPLIHLSKIKLFGREVDWKKNYDINRWEHTPKGLNLKYTENHITFLFEGISLKDPNGITYKYKLEGLSDNWTNTKQNEVIYPSLPYGNYVFYVKAIDSKGFVSEEPLEYHFIINPPFYLTWWFISLSIFIIALSIFIYIRMSLAKLRKDKHILEATVTERTAEIVAQKDIIEEKNRDITDSINYAQRIQKALLPSDKKLSSYFDDYFVLFRPKDIVSGDFYWANKLNNKILFTAADCTGHGVPGSIMSIIGNNGLENVIKNNSNISASEVLEQHTDFVINTFKQSGDANIKDGMDMALCVFDKENMILEFAGAHNPLYLVRNKNKGFDNFLTEDLLKLSNDNYNLFEIKADKQPVGDFEFRKPFNNNIINLLKGDTIYIFSDGYADQFGGPKGKKYKYKPFKRLILDIQEKALSEQRNILETSILEWMNYDNEEYEQVDDIIVFSVRF